MGDIIDAGNQFGEESVPKDIFEVKMYMGHGGFRVAQKTNIKTKESTYFGVSFLQMVVGAPGKPQIDLSGEYEFEIEGASDVEDAFSKFEEFGEKSKKAEADRRVEELKKKMSQGASGRKTILPGDPGFTPPQMTR